MIANVLCDRSFQAKRVDLALMDRECVDLVRGLVRVHDRPVPELALAGETVVDVATKLLAVEDQTPLWLPAY
jgi:hypothetical protein